MNKVHSLGLGLIVSAIIFTGCGGGGSSSVEGSSISFPKNAPLAKANLENGKKVRDATARKQTNGLVSLNSVSSNSKLNLAIFSSKLSQKISNSTKNFTNHTYSLNQTISNSEDCNSGKIIYSGSGDDVNGVNLTINFANCNNGSETMNGKMSLTAKNYDYNAEDFKKATMKFTTDFTVKNNYDNSVAKIVTGSKMIKNVSSYVYNNVPEYFKLNITIKAQSSTDFYGMEDCEYYFYNNLNTLEMYQTKGKIYIDNLSSYVEYDKEGYDMSQTPFVFNSDGTLQNGGEVRYNMANKGKVKIVVEDNEAKTYVDTDGDGSYDLSE